MGRDRSGERLGADGHLPNLGNPFPQATPCCSSQRSLRRLVAHSAGELTQAPNNRQLRRRFASRGGTPATGNRSAARFFSVRPGKGGRRDRPAREAVAGTIPVELKNFSECAELPRPGSPPAVDTLGASDRLENRKTCGISIGSALFIPPAKRFSALFRRTSRQRHAKFDRTDGETLQWATGRRDRTASTLVARFWHWPSAVGHPPRLDFEFTHRSARIALNSSPPSFFKGLESIGAGVPQRAARALQCSPPGTIHERPRCR